MPRSTRQALAERLFFELYGHALLGRPGTEGFLANAIEPWVADIAAALTSQAGVDERTARIDARLAVAVSRGLLLDLLATGDQSGVTEVFERFLQYTEPAFRGGAAQPREPVPAATVTEP
ncbi:MAG TPA: hypothetical protein VGI64_08880 [Streptosporangiaceae bacterium]